MAKREKSFPVLLLLSILILLNILGSQINLQLDLTDNKLYTLSEGSKKILSEIEEPIHLRFYFSRSVEDNEVTIRRKNYATIVEEILRQYVAESNGMINLEVIDPKPDTEAEADAFRVGIKGLELPNGQRFLFGLHFIQADREKTIPLFTLARERFLEYDLTMLIQQSHVTEKPNLGIISSLNLFPKEDIVGDKKEEEEWHLMRELRQFYNVEPVEDDYIPLEIDILLLIHPQGVSPTTEFSIDQFLLSGKPVVAIVDPSSVYQRKKSKNKDRPTYSNLSNLLKGYGIQFDDTMVVGDMDYAAELTVKGSSKPEPYPVWVELTDFNNELSATSMLELIRLAEAGSFNITAHPEVKVMPLIKSSLNSNEMMANIIPGSNPAQIRAQVYGENKERIFAALLKGKFNTAFPDGEPIVSKDESTAWIEKLNKDKPYIKKTIKESSLVVIADSDFLSDRFSIAYDNFSGGKIPVPTNDNTAFLLNMLEHICGKEELISLRSKGSAIRPFELVEELDRQAREAFKQKQTELQNELSQVDTELRRLQAERSTRTHLDLSSDVDKALKKFNRKKSDLLRDLREIKKKRRENVEFLSLSLVLINIIFVPTVIALYGIQFFINREKRKKK